MAGKKKQVSTASVVKGSHLTVTTDAAGKVSLEWDWDALARDVAEALAMPKPKTRKKKKE